MPNCDHNWFNVHGRALVDEKNAWQRALVDKALAPGSADCGHGYEGHSFSNRPSFGTMDDICGMCTSRMIAHLRADYKCLNLQMPVLS